MNRFIKRILPATALVGVLLLSAVAWSRGHPGDFDSERMLERMTDRLELSDTQQQEIGVILSEGAETGETDRTRMQEIRESLKAQKGDFDPGEAQKLADELGEITSRFAFQMASKHARIYSLLNEEQREEMDELAQKREEHMEKRFSRHRN